MVHLKVQVHLQLMLTATTEELELTTLCNSDITYFFQETPKGSLFLSMFGNLNNVTVGKDQCYTSSGGRQRFLNTTPKFTTQKRFSHFYAIVECTMRSGSIWMCLILIIGRLLILDNQTK